MEKGGATSLRRHYFSCRRLVHGGFEPDREFRYKISSSLVIACIYVEGEGEDWLGNDTTVTRKIHLRNRTRIANDTLSTRVDDAAFISESRYIVNRSISIVELRSGKVTLSYVPAMSFRSPYIT